MSRTISPVSGIPTTLSSGDSVLASFPDLAKPQPGGWLLKVNLAKDDECPMSATIELLQDKSQIGGGLVVIASTSVEVTETPTDYELEVTDEDIDFAPFGLRSTLVP